MLGEFAAMLSMVFPIACHDSGCDHHRREQSGWSAVRRSRGRRHAPADGANRAAHLVAFHAVRRSRLPGSSGRARTARADWPLARSSCSSSWMRFRCLLGGHRRPLGPSSRSTLRTTASCTSSGSTSATSGEQALRRCHTGRGLARFSSKCSRSTAFPRQPRAPFAPARAARQRGDAPNDPFFSMSSCSRAEVLHGLGCVQDWPGSFTLQRPAPRRRR